MTQRKENAPILKSLIEGDEVINDQSVIEDKAKAYF